MPSKSNRIAVISITPVLQHPDILTHKGHSAVVAPQTGKDLRRIPAFHLFVFQIGGNDGGLSLQIALVDQIILEGIENGEFDPTLDLRITRQMIFGTVDEISTTWVMTDYKYDLIGVADKVKRIILNGLKAS